MANRDISALALPLAISLSLSHTHTLKPTLSDAHPCIHKFTNTTTRTHTFSIITSWACFKLKYVLQFCFVGNLSSSFSSKHLVGDEADWISA